MPFERYKGIVGLENGERITVCTDDDHDIVEKSLTCFIELHGPNLDQPIVSAWIEERDLKWLVLC